MGDFEWNITKKKRTLRKHHVTFNEAATILKEEMNGAMIYLTDILNFCVVIKVQ